MSSGKYLLDTHALIWYQENNPKVPPHILQIIQDIDTVIFFSQVSLFEIAIKQKINKLPSFLATTNEVYEQAIKDNFTFLSIGNPHIYGYNQIPLLPEHRDPFDRLLIATANVEKAAIITIDPHFKSYPDWIKAIW